MNRMKINVLKIVKLIGPIIDGKIWLLKVISNEMIIPSCRYPNKKEITV